MLTVVFDLGDVLTSRRHQFAQASGVIGAVVDHDAYFGARALYDGGCSNLEYWSRVVDGLGVTMDASLADTLGRLDADLWCQIRPEAEAILADLHDAGVSVHVLSNAPRDTGPAIDRSPWRRFIGQRFISGALGVMKPDPAIYAHVEASLGLTPDDLAFIDDRADNVATAASLGWTTHLWISDADTRDWLTSLGLLLPGVGRPIAPPT